MLSTIHRAKGLEWDNVAVTGLPRGHAADLERDDVAQLDEERRLLYVAMTRPERDLAVHLVDERRHEARSSFLAPVATAIDELAAQRRPLEGDARSRRIAELRAALPRDPRARVTR